MELKASRLTYEFGLDEIRDLIASSLNVHQSRVAVEYKIQEVGGDPMDRYPGTKQVTAVIVTVDNK